MKTMSLGSRKGQSMVEGSLVYVLFFVILLGIFEWGRVVWVYNMLSNASREGARYAIAHGVEAASPATKDSITTIVKNQMIGMDPTAVSVDVTWNPDNKPRSTVAVTATCSVFPVLWFMPSSLSLRSRTEMIIFY